MSAAGYKATVQPVGGMEYVVTTDAPPEAINEVGMRVFEEWMKFALGQADLGGRRIIYPTGKYAASLRYEQLGSHTVAIYSDGSAPEAKWLEEGHAAFDMKKSGSGFTAGRRYPMKGPTGGPTLQGRPRAAGVNGFAAFGPNSDPNSWVIPAMPIYAPAKHLADLAKEALEK